MNGADTYLTELELRKRIAELEAQLYQLPENHPTVLELNRVVRDSNRILEAKHKRIAELEEQNVQLSLDADTFHTDANCLRERIQELEERNLELEKWMEKGKE